MKLSTFSFSAMIFLVILGCQSIPKNQNEKRLNIGSMVSIEKGTFQMGNEKFSPTHTIEISSFKLGKYLVTKKEFTEFVNATGYKTTAELEGSAFGVKDGKWDFFKDYSWRNPGFAQEENEPITTLSWFDCIAYCNWLSIKNGFVPVYSISNMTNITDFPDGWNKSINTIVSANWDANGFRLPTEAEWEYAAKGKNNTKYSGSNDLNEVGWYWKNPKMRTHIVGEKKPNSFDIYDMSGNVYEWCWDWYSNEYYKDSPITDPKGPDHGVSHSIRGGSWRHFENEAEVSYRSIEGNPLARDTAFGLRLAQNITE